MLYIILSITIYIYFEFILSLKKRKILELKSSLLDISIFEIFILIIIFSVLMLFEFNIIERILLFRFFFVIISIYVRLILVNIYYKYFININANYTYVNVLKPNIQIMNFFATNMYKYYIYHIFLISISFKLWLIYWLANEYVDLFIATVVVDYDTAFFGKHNGHDIILSPSGKEKLKLYILTLLDTDTNMFFELRKKYHSFDFGDEDFTYNNLDFNYKDKKIEYLASINC